MVNLLLSIYLKTKHLLKNLSDFLKANTQSCLQKELIDTNLKQSQNFIKNIQSIIIQTELIKCSVNLNIFIRIYNLKLKNLKFKINFKLIMQIKPSAIQFQKRYQKFHHPTFNFQKHKFKNQVQLKNRNNKKSFNLNFYNLQLLFNKMNQHFINNLIPSLKLSRLSNNMKSSQNGLLKTT